MTVPATPLEQELLATLRELPMSQQREVLDFAAFIKQRAPARGEEPRPFGLCAGEFEVPDDFDAPLPDDVLSTFEQ
jgi:hypothetical protein